MSAAGSQQGPASGSQPGAALIAGGRGLKSVLTGRIAKVGVGGGSSAEVKMTGAPERSYATGTSWSLTAQATSKFPPPVHCAQCSFTGMYNSRSITLSSRVLKPTSVSPAADATAEET